MDSKELRKKFIDYFVAKGHKELPAASLIPENDPSVLFTTAGMQQFKRYYLFPDEIKFSKAITVQKCIRTIDIDEVGDKTHHTFLEMLGNFSFGYPTKEGSYFKKEAIEFAWEFLSKTLGISTDRIYTTYFDKADTGVAITLDTDIESKEILENIKGLKRVESQGEDNFWSLGTENSPGGRTVEFYVDNIEVWNLVFNEMVRKGDHWQDLDFKGVDTGMGFERLLAVLEGKDDNYQTDLFQPLIQVVEKLSKFEYGDKKDEEYIKDGKQCWVDVRGQIRIIVDHIKAATFAINDGVLPSNKDAGYIVRRLIRRAVVKGHQLGIKSNFIKDVASKVFDIYSEVYDFDKENILSELEKEENKFRNTLNMGLKEFEKVKSNLDGTVAFKLYETYGFPIEMTEELAKESGIDINKKDFEDAFKKHQDLSRTASAGMFKGGLASGGEIETKFHTATHLLLAALREILGKDVNQKGANITAERIRFDFNYPEKLTDEQIKKIEDWVNEKINQNIDVTMEEMPLSKALESGATSIPGFKYPETVKVFSIGTISKEICGGPHVKNTSDLSHFKILKEESSSSGIRRLKAILQ